MNVLTQLNMTLDNDTVGTKWAGLKALCLTDQLCMILMYESTWSDCCIMMYNDDRSHITLDPGHSHVYLDGKVQHQHTNTSSVVSAGHSHTCTISLLSVTLSLCLFSLLLCLCDLTIHVSRPDIVRHPAILISMQSAVISAPIGQFYSLGWNLSQSETRQNSQRRRKVWKLKLANMQNEFLIAIPNGAELIVSF